MDITTKNQPYVEKYCFIDFEFNSSANKYLNLVSCSLMYTNPDPNGDLLLQEYWLKDDSASKKLLVSWIEWMAQGDYTFVAYAVTAEARAFLALTVDPQKYKWIDLYAEWLQLTYNNNDCEYGTYFLHGFKRTSVPPKYDSAQNKDKNNKAIGRSMGACVGQLFGIDIDQKHKTEMRDLIIANKEEYTPEEKKDIVIYCTSDVVYLPAMLNELTSRLMSAIKVDYETAREYQNTRGRYMVSVAKMENNGYPVEVENIKNLRANFDAAQDTILEDLVTNHYPFYIREKKRVSDIRGTWTAKYDLFEKFVIDNNLERSWPRTDSGKFSTEDKVLEDFQGIPDIKAFRYARKTITQLAWFKAKDALALKKDGDFFDSVGDDNRLRTFLGAYGTQTSRNAPKASRFILAMSSWLRCTVRPPKGRVIIGCDYASQEFQIAAWMSDDPKMIESYDSGDPYLYFAKMAKGVPMDADPVHSKTPLLILKNTAESLGLNVWHLTEEDHARIKELREPLYKRYEEYLKYQDTRNLFKSTTLGLQFGMGYRKLAVKLTSDTGRIVTESESEKLVRLHKKLYRVFWKWAERQELQHNRKKHITLADGWSLLKDIDNGLSIKNFPVQGTGAVIMRRAVELIEAEGIDILSPLHDALYVECTEDIAQETSDRVAELMRQATREVLKNTTDVRIDVDIHGHDEVWVEGKGAKHYELLKKYLEYLPSRETVEKETIEKLLSNSKYGWAEWK